MNDMMCLYHQRRWAKLTIIDVSAQPTCLTSLPGRTSIRQFQLTLPLATSADATRLRRSVATPRREAKADRQHERIKKVSAINVN